MTPQELILQHYPDADFTLPPLSNPKYVEAVDNYLIWKDKQDGVDVPVRRIGDYVIFEADYVTINRVTREADLVFEEEPKANAAQQAILSTFLHANYNTVTKLWDGLLVISGDLVLTSEGHNSLAEAKKPLQAYLGMFKNGTKTVAQIKTLWSVKNMNTGTGLEI